VDPIRSSYELSLPRFNCSRVGKACVCDEFVLSEPYSEGRRRSSTVYT